MFRKIRRPSISTYGFLAQLMEHMLQPPPAEIRQAIGAEPWPDEKQERRQLCNFLECDRFTTNRLSIRHSDLRTDRDGSGALKPTGRGALNSISSRLSSIARSATLWWRATSMPGRWGSAKGRSRRPTTWTAVDVDTGLIVHHEVTSEPNDTRQL